MRNFSTTGPARPPPPLGPCENMKGGGGGGIDEHNFVFFVPWAATTIKDKTTSKSFILLKFFVLK